MTKPYVFMPVLTEPGHASNLLDQMYFRHNRDVPWGLSDTSGVCATRPVGADMRTSILPSVTADRHLQGTSSPSLVGSGKLSNLQYSEKYFSERCAERKRDALVLVMRFLYDHGYNSAYHSLCAETRFSLNQVDTADNIDLLTVMHEYINHHRSKYGRTPVLTRQPLAFEPIVKLEEQCCKRQALGAQLRPSSSQQPSYHSQSSPQSHQTQYSHQLDKQPTATSDMLYTYTSTAAHTRVAPVVLVGDLPETAPQGLKLASTTLFSNTSTPVPQDEFIKALSGTAAVDPSTVFIFHRPKPVAVLNKRSSSLTLSNLQEDVLYALVGCVGVGWSLKNITEPTRSFLSNRFGISKELLQLFFKNRAQKRQRRDEVGTP